MQSAHQLLSHLVHFYSFVFEFFPALRNSIAQKTPPPSALDSQMHNRLAGITEDEVKNKAGDRDGNALPK